MVVVGGGSYGPRRRCWREHRQREVGSPVPMAKFLSPPSAVLGSGMACGSAEARGRL